MPLKDKIKTLEAEKAITEAKLSVLYELLSEEIKEELVSDAAEPEEPQEFKVGDQIKILADYSFFKNSETYKVIDVENDNSLWVIDDDGDRIHFGFDDPEKEKVK